MKMLVRRAQCGDADAFISLMEENRQALYRVACGFFHESGGYCGCHAGDDTGCLRTYQGSEKGGAFQDMADQNTDQ